MYLESIEINANTSIVTRATSTPFLIDSPAMLRALNSPVRQEIVDAFVAAGPCTIAELAHHLGRASDSLYFHVKRLAEVGLLVERDSRRDGRHVASVYDVPGRPIRIRYRAGSQGAARARSIDSVVQGAIRLGARDFSRAVASGSASTEGRGRNLWGGRAKGWVDEHDLAELNTLIERASAILHGGRPGPGRRPASFTFVLAPVQPSPRAPKRRAGPRTTKGVSP